MDAYVAARAQTARSRLMKRTDDISLWLANEAPHDTVKELFAGFCQKIVRAGIPVWRASLGLEVLHPEVSGWQHV